MRIHRHRHNIFLPTQHTLIVFYHQSHIIKPKRNVRNITLHRRNIIPTPIFWYGRSGGWVQCAGLWLQPYLSTYIILVYMPVSLWKKKKSSIVAHVVSEQHFMALINTQVRVVLDVTESNKNFPLIIIIIRELYIL